MRILGSFDTKKDEVELREKLAKYGAGNCLLFRRHPLYLVFRGGDALVMLLLLAGVLVVTFFQYLEDPALLWTFVSLYLAGVGTWLVMLAVHVVNRLRGVRIGFSAWDDSLMARGGFERLVAWSIGLFVFQVLVAGSNFATSLAVHDTDGWQIAFSLLQGAVNLAFVYLAWKLTLDLIDMEMDYIIVSPDEVVVYNQTGFFNRQSDSIGTDKIKSITVDKKGIIRSFFDLGAINILTEGDDKGGHIAFDFLLKPDTVREDCLRIVRSGTRHATDAA